jgi:hypothetical protein
MCDRPHTGRNTSGNDLTRKKSPVLVIPPPRNISSWFVALALGQRGGRPCYEGQIKFVGDWYEKEKTGKLCIFSNVASTRRELIPPVSIESSFTGRVCMAKKVCYTN